MAFKKGQTPWNKNLTKETDPRVKQYGESGSKTIKKSFSDGARTIWNKNLTKETSSSVLSTSKKLSQIVKDQYLKTGKEQWFSVRKNFHRRGHKNSELQKKNARTAILKTISENKLFKFKDTSIEKTTEQILISLNIHYIKQKHIERLTIVDFYIPEIRLCIYCDGTYWHNLPEVRIRDKRNNKLLVEMGYKVLRLSQKEIEETPEYCLSKLKEIMI